MKIEIARSGFTVMAALVVYGCGDSAPRSHTLPWQEDRTQIIATDGTVRQVPTPSGASCLDIPRECVQPQLTCEGRASDLILDRDDRVLQTVCYPAGNTLTVEEIAARDGNVAQNQNNAVIALDGLDDGADIAGDLSIDANNVVVYADDPARALIAGDLKVDGNNIIVRGVTVGGDVSVEKNNATFVHCVIEGDVVVRGNNTVIAGCTIWGTLTIEANNTKLVGNRVVGSVQGGGKNTECSGNFSAIDANQNGIVEEAELGAELSCDR